ncbi:MAG: DUF4097 domain-containing protein [Clostridia bacterium]|nr:DUF4097 domain-containing protein [Clostridia bacterium]
MSPFFDDVKLALGEVKLVNTREIPMEGVERVSISYISENITLHAAEGDALVLKEYFNKSDEAYFADVHTEGDSLTIRSGERRMLFGMLSGYVEIFLPKAFFGTLNVKSVSGRIQSTRKLTLCELTVSSTSGRIQLADTIAGTAVLYTVSGAISVSGLSAYATVHSTSGAITIQKAEGKGEFKTVSGMVEVHFASVAGDITAKSTSGRVRIGLPSAHSYYLDANTVSGGLQAPALEALGDGKRSKSGTVGTSPQGTVRVSTVSGRIEVFAEG